MTDDLNRKTLRQFQCRDYLWEAFEQMSQELECSVDYLINEAMRHYARGQGKLRQNNTAAPGVRTNMPGMAPPQVPQQAPMAPPMAPPMPQAARPMGPPGMQGNPMGNPGMGPPPGARPGAPPPLMGANGGARPVPQAPQSQQGYGAPPPPRMPSMQQGPMQQPSQQGYPPQPQRPPAPNFGQPAQGPGGAILYAVYEGQKYPVNKEEFFIGRSNKTCDLIVKDPNVSRQHARIVRHGGQFWMLDMGSTNGIEYQGGRVDRHVISEGDVFRICDHEIVFTYR